MLCLRYEERLALGGSREKLGSSWIAIDVYVQLAWICQSNEPMTILLRRDCITAVKTEKKRVSGESSIAGCVEADRVRSKVVGCEDEISRDDYGVGICTLSRRTQPQPYATQHYASLSKRTRR